MDFVLHKQQHRHLFSKLLPLLLLLLLPVVSARRPALDVAFEALERAAAKRPVIVPSQRQPAPGGYEFGQATYYDTIGRGFCEFFDNIPSNGFVGAWPFIESGPPGSGMGAWQPGVDGDACGKCFEVSCVPQFVESADGSIFLDRRDACRDESLGVIIEIVDECRCSNPGRPLQERGNFNWCCNVPTPRLRVDRHIDLSLQAFTELVRDGNFGLGILGIKWRPAPCDYIGLVRINADGTTTQIGTDGGSSSRPPAPVFPPAPPPAAPPSPEPAPPTPPPPPPELPSPSPAVAEPSPSPAVAVPSPSPALDSPAPLPILPSPTPQSPAPPTGSPTPSSPNPSSPTPSSPAPSSPTPNGPPPPLAAPPSVAPERPPSSPGPQPDSSPAPSSPAPSGPAPSSPAPTPSQPSPSPQLAQPPSEPSSPAPPQPSPVSQPLQELPAGSQCGGEGWYCNQLGASGACADAPFPGYTCGAGLDCVRYNAKLWRCWPSWTDYDYGQGPDKPQPGSSPDKKPDSQADKPDKRPDPIKIPEGSQCGGSAWYCASYGGYGACKDAKFPGYSCDTGLECLRSSKYYWACLPADQAGDYVLDYGGDETIGVDGDSNDAGKPSSDAGKPTGSNGPTFVAKPSAEKP